MTTTQPPPSGNFLLRFWRGGYSLALSYWLVGLMLNLASIALVLGLSLLIRRRAFDPYAIAAALFAMWGASAAIVIFQSVGVWRAAARHRTATGRNNPDGQKPGKYWRGLWSVLAQISVVAGIVSFGYQFAHSGARQLEETWRMAFEDDPDIPGYTLRAMRDGTEMEIAGGFKYGLTRDAREIVDDLPDLKVVHLASGGGRLGEARELAKLIHDRGLSTYTATACLSACTIAFIAGRERFLKAGGKLGFHRAAFAGVENSAAMSGLLLAAGIERPFVDRVVAQPASGMWYPSVGELQAAHVVTAVVDSRRFAASGLGAAPGALDFARDLRTIGVYRALEEAEPGLFLRLVDRYQSGYTEGQSEGAIQDRLGAMAAPRIRAHIATADDAVLVDYANLLADQYAAIGARDGRTCFLRITRGATADQAGLLGAELGKREQALQERALRGSRPRTAAPPELLQDDYAAVFKQLGGRYSAAELRMFGHPDTVTPAQYATYCRLTTAIFRGIAALPPTRAGDVMSAQFRSMNAAAPEK